MIRIDSYEDLTDRIVRWLKDYYWQYSMKAFVVGVSGGIDSAVVSSLSVSYTHLTLPTRLPV